jgi:hypothetical protein
MCAKTTFLMSNRLEFGRASRLSISTFLRWAAFLSLTSCPLPVDRRWSGLAPNSVRAGTNVPVTACGDALRGESAHGFANTRYTVETSRKDSRALREILPAWPVPNGLLLCCFGVYW